MPSYVVEFLQNGQTYIINVKFISSKVQTEVSKGIYIAQLTGTDCDFCFLSTKIFWRV